MRLLGRVTAPAVEGVIKEHAGFELLQVVGIHAREAERGGEKPRRFRFEIEPRGIGTPHDSGEAQERLDEAQRALREIPGTTVLIYEQECAAELRRKRRRGLAVRPERRVFIN